MLHHQSSTVATSAGVGAGAAATAASSADPHPAGAVSFVPAAVPAGLTSSSGTQLAVSAGSAVQSAADMVDEVRIALRDCKESIKKCGTKIDGIETEISTFKIRLAALGVSDDAERDELKSCLATLESNLAKLDSNQTLMRQLQLKLQDEKVILLRQQEALSAQSRESKEAAGSLSQYNSITPRSHDCCNRTNVKSLSFYCAECRRFVLERILYECVSII